MQILEKKYVCSCICNFEY